MLSSLLCMLLQASPVPTFGAQVQLVSFTMNAVDERTGRTIADLAREDLQVLEDGKRQEIVHFEREDVPASVIILLDTSTSMRRLIPAVRNAAARLVRTLRPVDEVQVATFDTRYRLLCDFTTDREAAVGALAGIVEGETTALNWALYTAMRFLERRYPEDVERRRVLIVLSDGEDTHASMSYASTLDALRRSPVACYFVHLQGYMVQSDPKPNRQELARAFVRDLTQETGGRSVSIPYPHERFLIDRAFNDISGDLGSQYHVAYISSADPSQTGWRVVHLEMTRRIGVRLSYRRTYFVPERR